MEAVRSLYATFSLRLKALPIRWVHTVQRLVSLGEASCFNTARLCQIHQFLVCCRVEPRLRMEAINKIWALKETCREPHSLSCTHDARSY